MASDVSVSCDVGAHERCAGCACGCHAKDSSSVNPSAGEAQSPGAGVVRHTAGAGSLVAWDAHRDRRLLIQIVSAAIPGAIAVGLFVLCIVLAAGGLL